MRIFEQLEGAIETMVEGFFRRRSRRPIQPVEIGRSLLRAMEAQKMVSISKTYVPNVFQIQLHPEENQALGAMHATLSHELKGVLQEKAEKENLSFIGELEIQFQSDDQLLSGDIRIRADFSESSAEGDAPTIGNTMIFSPDTLASVDQKPRLVVEGAAQEGYWLRDGFTIGRSRHCDLPIHDANASRIHASIHHREDEWVVTDNDSTNGTLVNGTRIRQHTLRPGDRIQIGKTVLKFGDQH